MKAVQAASAAAPCSAFVGTIMNAGAGGAQGMPSTLQGFLGLACGTQH